MLNDMKLAQKLELAKDGRYVEELFMDNNFLVLSALARNGYKLMELLEMDPLFAIEALDYAVAHGIQEVIERAFEQVHQRGKNAEALAHTFIVHGLNLEYFAKEFTFEDTPYRNMALILLIEMWNNLSDLLENIPHDAFDPLGIVAAKAHEKGDDGLVEYIAGELYWDRLCEFPPEPVDFIKKGQSILEEDYESEYFIDHRLIVTEDVDETLNNLLMMDCFSSKVLETVNPYDDPEAVWGWFYRQPYVMDAQEGKLNSLMGMKESSTDSILQADIVNSYLFFDDEKVYKKKSSDIEKWFLLKAETEDFEQYLRNILPLSTLFERSSLYRTVSKDETYEQPEVLDKELYGYLFEGAGTLGFDYLEMLDDEKDMNKEEK